MTTFNIFYNNNKEIIWTTTGDVNDAIKTAQSGLGNSYVQLTLEDIDINNYHINSDASGVTEKTAFDFAFSTTTPTVDQVINVTGLPAGTEVFLDEVSQGTMSVTTLTLTTQEPGNYTVRFYKLLYKTHSGTTVISKRHGE